MSFLDPGLTEKDVRRIVHAEITSVLWALVYLARGNADQNASARDYEHVADIIEKAPLRKIWVAADQKAPQAWDKTNASLANAISNGALQARIEAKLAELEGKTKAILIVTDLEALHPYTRIGVIEGKLQGKFHVPTVFLYPGVRTGKTRLKFLGFYPDDGNYRSVHVGG